jgi:hypothetical protein
MLLVSEIGDSYIDWAQLSRFFFLRTETKSSLRNFVLNKNRTMNGVQKSKLLFNIYCLIILEFTTMCF